MLASIIESVLVKHLGKYVDGIENNMDIGLIDGEVTVENVSLKTSFINGLGLPFILRFSHIEKIHINIPWTSLKEKNTIVTVHGIYCLLEMDYEDSQEQFDPHERLKGFVDHIKKEVKKGWQER